MTTRTDAARRIVELNRKLDQNGLGRSQRSSTMLKQQRIWDKWFRGYAFEEILEVSGLGVLETC